MKRYDVLLIARPDHSYRIYKELLRGDLTFKYFTFKLFPKWTEFFLKNKKIRFVERGYSLNYLLSIISIFRNNLRISFFRRFSEYKIFDRMLRYYIKDMCGKVVHYWPCFSVNTVAHYKRNHPDSITLADVYFPCHQYVIDEMTPILRTYGLESSLNYVFKEKALYEQTMLFENNFLVPSKFVADTYKKYYPEKNYIIRSYGIAKCSQYEKKKYIADEGHIYSFIYVGQISIAKGGDILCNYFSKHPEYVLHIVGVVAYQQEAIFEKYKTRPNIIFHGHIAQKEIPNVAKKCDIGIHLSRFDAYSLAVGEIIGVGLPMIVSDKTGNADDIEKYKWGVVTELDEESIDIHIKELTTAPRYNEFVDSIDRYIKEMHPTYSEQIIELYNTIITNGHI